MQALQGGIPPKAEPELSHFLERLGSGWMVVEVHNLEKKQRFKDFGQALAFTNRVGELAESVGHHPDLHLARGRVGVIVWTHTMGGASGTAFVLAANVDSFLD